jgi:hypothetical protein
MKRHGQDLAASLKGIAKEKKKKIRNTRRVAKKMPARLVTKIEGEG